MVSEEAISLRFRLPRVVLMLDCCGGVILLVVVVLLWRTSGLTISIIPSPLGPAARRKSEIEPSSLET